MKTLYADLEPYARHRLPRGRHALYVEECGAPGGVPVLFLHGGPGSGCRPYHRAFFDPSRYRAVLLDQRGAGRSTPQGELSDNATADLLEDLEAVRRHLGIERWALFGGSWGATLALLYAQNHPERCLGLVLRGSFLARPRDLDWFLGPDGVRRLYPDRWAECLDDLGVSAEAEADPVAAFRERLNGDDELAQRRAARAWTLWSEQVLLGADFRPKSLGDPVSAQQIHQARIELHYAAHRYFLPDNAILARCHRIAHLPAILVHGRKDWICPPESSYALHRALPRSELRWVPEGGHIATGEAMIDALVTAAGDMLDRLADPSARQA
jgi:proline iminopeptidase